MRKLLILSAFFAIVSCQFKTAEDPVNTAEGIPAEQIYIGGVLAESVPDGAANKTTASDQPSAYIDDIGRLGKQLEQLKAQRKELETDSDLSKAWEFLNEQVLKHLEALSTADFNAWVALNDSLLKYTEEVRFADALERMAYNPVGENQLQEDQIKSVFYTRLYDRIYFNLYGSSSLQYEHTTGGVVRLVQETNYPFDGVITLKVELQDTRYLDFYFRIPEWANRASVTCKGVKYPVEPGEFTEIAKKWKNGEEVEIILGMRPTVLEREETDPAFALTYGSLFLSYPSPDDESLAFAGSDPIQYLNFVSPAGRMPTFTFSGIQDTSLVLQPYFAEDTDTLKRTAWIRTAN